MTPPVQRPKPSRRLGLLGLFGVLVATGCLLMAALGALNTAFDWQLVLSVSGASVEVPRHYEVCLALAGFSALLLLLTFSGSATLHAFRTAKGRPLARVGIVFAAALLLALVGRGLYVWAILDTYGSFLAYYATDGELDDLRGELEGATTEELDRAVDRAAQYDNHAALEVLLAAGADLRQSTRDHRGCLLAGASAAFVQVALAHGTTPVSCPESEALIATCVWHARDDDALLETLPLLVRGGWSPSVPNDRGEAPAALAARRGLPRSAAWLRSAITEAEP